MALSDDLRHVLAHADASWRELARIPSFTIPSFALPVLFFVMFGVGDERGAPADASSMAGYAAFAMLGVVLFDFGVSIAVDREHPWDRIVRTLPARRGVRFGARLLVGLSFGAVASALVVAVGVAADGVRLPAGRWWALAGVLLLGALPFAALGTAIGSRVPARSASPIASLLFLPMSFLGGLWGDVDGLPGPIAALGAALPTRSWAQIVDGAVSGTAAPARWWAGLLGWTVVLSVLAVTGERHARERRS